MASLNGLRLLQRIRTATSPNLKKHVSTVQKKHFHPAQQLNNDTLHGRKNHEQNSLADEQSQQHALHPGQDKQQPIDGERDTFNHAEDLKSDSSTASSFTMTLLLRTFYASIAGASLYGLYHLGTPIENDQAVISNDTHEIQSSSYFKNSKKRIMGAYKKLVDPASGKLLPDTFPSGHAYFKPYTLLLELDKTLVYSNWSKEHGWKVAKRPWADYFLAYMSQFYEVVVFTDQTPFYAAPILDKLDQSLGAILYRLYRDSTCYDIDTGKHVKDLSLLNRDLARTILIDHSQQLPQQVQLTIPEWEGDPNDSYLLDLIPFLETLAVSGTPDVRGVLQSYAGKDVPNVFAENMARVQKHQRDLFDQRKATNSWSRFFGSFFSLSPNAPQEPIPPAEFAQMQVRQHQQFMQELESHRLNQAQEVQKMEEEQKRMLDKAKKIKVTLWEMMTLGADAAIKHKADPDVRDYFDRMAAAQGQLSPSTASST